MLFSGLFDLKTTDPPFTPMPSLKIKKGPKPLFKTIQTSSQNANIEFLNLEF